MAQGQTPLMAATSRTDVTPLNYRIYAPTGEGSTNTTYIGTLTSPTGQVANRLLEDVAVPSDPLDRFNANEQNFQLQLPSSNPRTQNRLRLIATQGITDPAGGPAISVGMAFLRQHNQSPNSIAPGGWGIGILHNEGLNPSSPSVTTLYLALRQLLQTPQLNLLNNSLAINVDVAASLAGAIGLAHATPADIDPSSQLVLDGNVRLEGGVNIIADRPDNFVGFRARASVSFDLCMRDIQDNNLSNLGLCFNHVLVSASLRIGGNIPQTRPFTDQQCTDFLNQVVAHPRARNMLLAHATLVLNQIGPRLRVQLSYLLNERFGVSGFVQGSLTPDNFHLFPAALLSYGANIHVNPVDFLRLTLEGSINHDNQTLSGPAHRAQVLQGSAPQENLMNAYFGVRASFVTE